MADMKNVTCKYREKMWTGKRNLRFFQKMFVNMIFKRQKNPTFSSGTVANRDSAYASREYPWIHLRPCGQWGLNHCTDSVHWFWLRKRALRFDSLLEPIRNHVDNEDQGGNETWHPWWERTWQRCWATINRTRPFWDIRMRMTVWNVRSPTIWGEDKAHSSSTGAAPTVWFSLKPSAAMWKQRITWPDKLSYQVNVGGWSSSTRAVSTVWFSPWNRSRPYGQWGPME